MNFFKIQRFRPEIQKLFDYIENNQDKIRFNAGLIEIRLPENDILNIFFDGDMHISRYNNSPLPIILKNGERRYSGKLYNSLIRRMQEKKEDSALEYISNLFSKTRSQVEKAVEAQPKVSLSEALNQVNKNEK